MWGQDKQLELYVINLHIDAHLANLDLHFIFGRSHRPEKTVTQPVWGIAKYL